jgi:cytochrome P450
MFDDKIYPEAQKFDGHRFLKLRAQPGQENHWQFVTTSPEHTGFGHGMHACPGRFFASNEVKVALCFLLLRYEWKQESPQGMPATFEYGSEIIANPMMKIAFRRRKEELDILSIIGQN